MLTGDDLDGAFGLSAAAGWNQRLADWRMLLLLAPAGSFAAVDDGRIVGTAIGIDYGAFGWIAMMLVDHGWRGRGVGSRLLEAAMGGVPPGTPIRLDATPLGRPLYKRYGFEDEAGYLRGLTAADLPSVTAVDDRIFGARRRTLFGWALAGAPQYAHLIETGAAQIVPERRVVPEVQLVHDVHAEDALQLKDEVGGI